MINIEQDRRETPRIVVKRPCKVFDPKARKYLAGSTCDMSSGGLLLRLNYPLGLGPGDRIFVGVAQTRRQMLLRTKDMAEAEIVRSMDVTDRETILAVRFVDSGMGMLPLTRRAA